MVRNYKKKSRSYSEGDLKLAVETVRAGEDTLRAVAKRFGIDKSLLSRRVNEVPIGKQGRKPVFSKEQEDELTASLKIMSKWGFGLTKKEVLSLIQDYVNENDIKTPFKDGIPGDDWFQNFCSRNKLSLKKPEALEVHRRKATSDPFVIYEFYDLLDETLTSLNIKDKPSHIYNLDESSFSMDPSRLKAVAQVGQKVHRNIQGSGKENLTVLACCSAAGHLMPPLVIFQAQNLWTTWRGEKDIPGTFYACSDKGWMTSQIFQDYFGKFCDSVKERPLLLVFDGHLTHLDPGTLKRAQQENIAIIKLPSHTTDLLQPLDKTCFRPLKMKWDANLIDWQRKNQRKMTKSEFVDNLCLIWHDGMTEKTIKNGFLSTGIFPNDSGKYPVSRLDPQKLQRYNEQKESSATSTVVTDGGTGIEIRTLKETPGKSQDQSSPSSQQVDLTLRASSLSTGTAISPSTPSTSASSPSPNSPLANTGSSTPVNFEMLLLERIKKTDAPTTTRRKVDVRSKLVTSKEFLDAIEKKMGPIRKKVGSRVMSKKKKVIAKTSNLHRPSLNKNKKRVRRLAESSSSDTDAGNENDSDMSVEEESASDEDVPMALTLKDNLKINNHVIFEYEGEFFPGLVVLISDDGPQVQAMRMAKQGWKWPEIADVHWYAWNKVLEIIPPPTLLQSRGLYAVPEIRKFQKSVMCV